MKWEVIERNIKKECKSHSKKSEYIQNFIVYSKKLKKTENISIQGFGHLSTADSRPWQKSE